MADPRHEVLLLGLSGYNFSQHSPTTSPFEDRTADKAFFLTLCCKAFAYTLLWATRHFRHLQKRPSDVAIRNLTTFKIKSSKTVSRMSAQNSGGTFIFLVFLEDRNRGAGKFPFRSF